MGGRDYRKKLAFRATEEEVAKVESLVKASGLSQQEYLLSAALGRVVNGAPHTSLVAASNIDSAKVSAGGSSGGSLKGMDAKVVLLEAKTAWIKSANGDNEKVLWHDGAMWLVGKDSHSQDLLKRLLEFPSGLFDSLNVYGSCYTLAECREALSRCNELKALDYIDAVTIADGGDRVSPLSVIGFAFCAKVFKQILQETKEAIAKHKQALQEATSDVELSSSEMVADAARVAPIPLDEVVETQLTDAEFLVRFSIDKSDQVYSDACKAGYTDSDGNIWLKSGGKKTRVWVMQVKTNTHQLELAIV